jgi:mRNA interferase MazF
MVKYVPSRGDIVWLEFDPQKGREIQKTRPTIVISPQKYNQKTGMALFMPITSQIKTYPFEVVIDFEKIKGAVLCDQIRSLDWQARHAKFITKLPQKVIEEIMSKLMVLLVD